MTKRKNDYEEICNRKRRKILPDSAIKKEIQNLTPFNSKSAQSRRLFPEKQKRTNFPVIILPLLAVGIYAVSTDIANFNLFTGIGIFAAVALVCFCLIKLIEGDDKKGMILTQKKKPHSTMDTIESSKTYATQGVGKI